ncbi:MAG: S-disulfanyl-L-cysteine oxidoreductase SoxD, partial [Bradyrhizobium sp.]
MRWRDLLMIAVIGVIASTASVRAQSKFGIGRVATPDELAGWNIDIGRDGSGLPGGSGTVSHGRD